MIRIGFDVGGSKLAVIALDERGAELGRDRCQVPRDYRGTLDALIGMTGAGTHAGGGDGALGRHRPSRHDRCWPASWSAWSICPGSRACRFAPICSARSAGPWRSPTTPTALRCPRRSMAPRLALPWCSA